MNWAIGVLLCAWKLCYVYIYHSMLRLVSDACVRIAWKCEDVGVVFYRTLDIMYVRNLVISFLCEKPHKNPIAYICPCITLGPCPYKATSTEVNCSIRFSWIWVWKTLDWANRTAMQIMFLSPRQSSSIDSIARRAKFVERWGLLIRRLTRGLGVEPLVHPSLASSDACPSVYRPRASAKRRGWSLNRRPFPSTVQKIYG